MLPRDRGRVLGVEACQQHQQPVEQRPWCTQLSERLIGRLAPLGRWPTALWVGVHDLHEQANVLPGRAEELTCRPGEGIRLLVEGVEHVDGVGCRHRPELRLLVSELASQSVGLGDDLGSCV